MVGGSNPSGLTETSEFCYDNKTNKYPNGKALPLDIPATISLGQFFLRDRSRAGSVAEGSENITPLSLTKDVFDYLLEAKPAGDGELQMQVKDTEDAREASDGLLQLENRVIRIPQDQSSFALVGPRRDDPRMHVFEILYHESGRSPRRHKER